MNIIETKRLILRTWQESDYEPMCQINQDKLVMEYFPELLDEKQTQKLISKVDKHYKDHGFTFYATELKDTHEFIGMVGLAYVEMSFTEHFTPNIEIGWRLAHKFWGKGYATEAASAVLDYAFNKINLKEVVSFTTVNNERSRRVMEKIGMTNNPSDNFDHPKIPDDHPLKRHVLYRISKDVYDKDH